MPARSAMNGVHASRVLDFDEELSKLFRRIEGKSGKWRFLPEPGEEIEPRLSHRHGGLARWL